MAGSYVIAEVQTCLINEAMTSRPKSLPKHVLGSDISTEGLVAGLEVHSPTTDTRVLTSAKTIAG